MPPHSNKPAIARMRSPSCSPSCSPSSSPQQSRANSRVNSPSSSSPCTSPKVTRGRARAYTCAPPPIPSFRNGVVSPNSSSSNNNRERSPLPHKSSHNNGVLSPPQVPHARNHRARSPAPRNKPDRALSPLSSSSTRDGHVLSPPVVRRMAPSLALEIKARRSHTVSSRVDNGKKNPLAASTDSMLPHNQHQQRQQLPIAPPRIIMTSSSSASPVGSPRSSAANIIYVSPRKQPQSANNVEAPSPSPLLLSPSPLRATSSIARPNLLLSPSSSRGNNEEEEIITSRSDCLSSKNANGNALKSSHGFNMLKTPMMKDLLLNSISSSSRLSQSAPTSPRPRSPPPAFAPMSPTRPRNFTEPIPLHHNHLERRTELTGSSDAISMPYNITHTTHVDFSNLSMLAKDRNLELLSSCNIPTYEKSGYLHKLAGSVYKERWFVCKNSILYYYKKQESKKPRGQIYLNDCEFHRDKLAKRPFTLRVLHTPTKKNYYLSALLPELYDEWIRVLQGAGAIDKDFVVMEQDTKEREKKEAEKRQAKGMKKQEDEYVKEKRTKRSTLKLINKNMSLTAMETCRCETIVKKTEIRDEVPEFRIEIMFDDQEWTIFRKYEKIVKLYESVSKLKFIKGMCPPRKAPSAMSEDEFAEVQRESVQNLLDLLSRNRPCVFALSGGKQGFLRFLAPVGWNDIKTDQFIMPFQFDF